MFIEIPFYTKRATPRGSNIALHMPFYKHVMPLASFISSRFINSVKTLVCKLLEPVFR